MVNNLFTSLLGLLAPHLCIACDQASHRDIDLCLNCQADFPALPTAQCCICALPLATANLGASAYCAKCLKKPPSFNKLVATWLYQYPIAELISQFKYQRKLCHGKVLSHLLVKTIRQSYPEQDLPQLLIPTPMHSRRLLSRGFNQSEILAQQISSQIGIKINRSLIRHQHTAKQQGQNARQRLQNLKTAFKVKSPEDIQGLKIAIIDDVVTTTATAEAMSRCLIKAGAAEVHIWCLARTPINLR